MHRKKNHLPVNGPVLAFCCLLMGYLANAQDLTVGSVGDNTARSLQLLNRFDSLTSFMIRPIAVKDTLGLRGARSIIAGHRLQVALLPLRLTQQYNAHHPYGWNDGAMIGAKGYQALASAGVYVKTGPLELQLQPEFVYAANNSYEHSLGYGNLTGGAYQKLFPGQSYLKVSAWNVSAGVSTANLWWGPGKRSSLLMSNNAPGFLHGFIRSQAPMKTPIGSFEWMLIGAKLTADRSRPFENYHMGEGPGNAHNRYLNSIVITYQPKWTPGIFLGLARSLQRETNDLGQLGGSTLMNKYFPILFKPLEKQGASDDDSLRTDQLASFFLRWVFPKANMEFYAEYGFNDYGYNIRDYLMSPSHSAAYIFGVNKVIKRGGEKRIELGFELTQMSQSPDWMVREAGNWYTHSQVEEGYTHQNQIIGAGAGLGTNVLSLEAAWVDGVKRLGFMLERVNRDPQYHVHKWIDLGLGFMPQWKYRQFLLSGLLEVIKTRNYLWETGKTRFNVHSQFTVQYFF